MLSPKPTKWTAYFPLVVAKAIFGVSVGIGLPSALLVMSLLPNANREHRDHPVVGPGEASYERSTCWKL